MENFLELGLLGLFISSFIAATIIPFSSELVLSILLANQYPLATCLIIATLGNWLGGISSYGLGRLGEWTYIKYFTGLNKTKIGKVKEKVDKWKSPLAFFCWLPLVGDVFAVGLGFYKINFFKVSLWMFIGKMIRYLVWALITILGSTFYCIGGLLTLKLKNKKNENVTTSTTVWSVICLLPFSLILETPWNSSPTLASTLSLLYLGVIATGLAWLIRFRILTVNGLVFQTQVAYLIPIFGIIFGYFLMDEIITWKVIVSLVVILIGIYIFKKNNKG